MKRDRAGNPVVFHVYDRSRRGTATRWHRVATFRDPENADRFLEKEGREELFISCNTATVKDFSLARD